MIRVIADRKDSVVEVLGSYTGPRETVRYGQTFVYSLREPLSTWLSKGPISDADVMDARAVKINVKRVVIRADVICHPDRWSEEPVYVLVEGPDDLWSGRYPHWRVPTK